MLLEDGVLLPPSLVGHLVALFQIAARAKSLGARPGQNDAPDAAGIDVPSAEQIPKVPAHLGVDGVGALRTIQRNHRQMLFRSRHQQRFVMSFQPPSTRLRNNDHALDAAYSR